MSINEWSFEENKSTSICQWSYHLHHFRDTENLFLVIDFPNLLRNTKRITKLDDRRQKVISTFVRLKNFLLRHLRMMHLIESPKTILGIFLKLFSSKPTPYFHTYYFERRFYIEQTSYKNFLMNLLIKMQ